MLRRLLGQETEYAIRASPRPGQSRPSNLPVYHAIADAIDGLVHTRPSSKLGGLESFFVENGGAFCYEFLPSDIHGGLCEGSTPECRGPSELLLYQKAQERLLINALDTLRDDQCYGDQNVNADIGLIKNCRDAKGKIYGAQENYEVELASGLMLWLYRLGLALLLPGVLVVSVLTWALILLTLVVILALVPPLVVALVVGEFMPRWGRALENLLHEDGPIFRVVMAVIFIAELILSTPLATAYALLLRLTAFRKIRAEALAFLVTRCVFTGAGSVEPDGRLALSEKGLALRRTIRSSGGTHSRSIIDTGNLLKGLLAPPGFRLRPLLTLFRKRQRLQLGLSDSNMAHVAEYLKVGTTCLVIDMVESGWLRDVPQVVRPVRAVLDVVNDPTLSVQISLRSRQEMRALDVQRWYLEQARQFVAAAQAPSIEAREVIRLWEECLDALERDPGELVGRIDWVTKRWLLEAASSDAPQTVRKKIDIKYHELGGGYFARLERDGLAPILVTEAEAERAICEPPSESPARIRSRLIKDLASEQTVTVDWDCVRIGGRLGRVGGKVIRLDDFRR